MLAFATLSSQAQFLADNNNRPITEKRYVNITGSPYFSDEFIIGSVTVSDKNVYNNLLLQLDEVRDVLIFRENRTGAPTLEFTTPPVIEFTLKPQSGQLVKFRRISNGEEKINGFSQILLEGKVSLLKKTKKTIIQNATYSTANVEKTVVSSTLYSLLFTDNKVASFKTDKKSFLKAAGDKTTELEAYSKSQNIDFKNEEDLIKLVTYYNSL